MKSQLTKLPAEAFSASSSFENNSAEPIVYTMDNVLEQCYTLDTNSMPAMYRLQRISKIIPDYVSAELKRQEYSRVFWDKVQGKVSGLLRKAADLAFENNLIDELKRERYFISSNVFACEKFFRKPSNSLIHELFKLPRMKFTTV